MTKPGRKATPAPERFTRLVEPQSDGCWHWTGHRNNKGYGTFSLGPIDTGKPWAPVYAHRWSYEYHNGPIPDGLVVDHLCGIRHCVNPEHLRVCTPRENILAGKGEMIELHHLGQCRRGHDMRDPANQYIRPDTGKAMCRECHLFRARRNVQARRSA